MAVDDDFLITFHERTGPRRGPCPGGGPSRVRRLFGRSGKWFHRAFKAARNRLAYGGCPAPRRVHALRAVPAPRGSRAARDRKGLRLDPEPESKWHQKWHWQAPHWAWTSLSAGKDGAPGVNRTPGPGFRKPLLYPTELRGPSRILDCYATRVKRRGWNVLIRVLKIGSRHGNCHGVPAFKRASILASILSKVLARYTASAASAGSHATIR
jgi:hypothetical protein